jgi:hypothetical protein
MYEWLWVMFVLNVHRIVGKFQIQYFKFQEVQKSISFLLNRKVTNNFLDWLLNLYVESKK